jgi:uncharacterized protein YdeI (YjbR/CyaY-like superfamily)
MIKQIFNKYKQYIKIGLGIIVFLVALFWFIRWITPKEKIPEDMKHRLDSLDKASQYWEKYKQSADSVIIIYKDSLKISQDNVKNINKQQTIIREYYHETINNIDRYTYDELDGWIRTRYKEYYK